MKKFMSSPRPGERETALDNYPQGDKTILPILLDMIKSDVIIGVVQRAVSRFNTLTKQSFDFWKTQEILDRWGKNSAAGQ
jgi:hypothetical protein